MPFFLIDQRSALDETVIVCMPDYSWGLRGLGLEEEKEKAQELLKDVVGPEIRGFLYGWVKGREAHNAFQNLSIANLDWDELFDDMGRESSVALRPGWPGHGILGNEWEVAVSPDKSVVTMSSVLSPDEPLLSSPSASCRFL
ncbi:hypothetical protein BDV06DRAFT_39490 [Aspergillus oleicola]